MIANLTVQDLAAALEERLRQMEADTMRHAAKPRYPMLTAFFGAGAAGDCPAFFERLRQYWPENALDLKFLKMEDAAGTDGAELRPASGEELPAEAVPGELSRRLTGELLQSGAKFVSYERFFLVSLLDSGDMEGETGPRLWLEARRRVREETAAALPKDCVLSDMLILLLDEKNDTESLRRELLQIREEDAAFPITLLFNTGADSGQWERCLSAAAAAVAVFNGGIFPEGLFRDGGFFAAGYAREEKPFRAIAETVARGLLDWLAESGEETAERLFEDREALKARLGVSVKGTFSFLDEYVTFSLMPYVPSRKDLECFPIPVPDEANHARLTSNTISSKELNDFTFGAWDICVTEGVRKAREQVERDLPDFTRWKEEYAALLDKNFTPGEQALLAERKNRVKGLLKFARLPSRDLPALVYAERWLHYLVDSSPELMDVLTEVIRKQGEKSAAFLRERNALLSSLETLPPVPDKDMTGYYKGVLKLWFERRGETLRQKFLSLRDRDALTRYLERMVEELLEDEQLRGVFQADVQEEFQARMGTFGDPVRPFRGGAPLYLRTEEAPETPLWSFLLHRADSTLGSFFRAHLPENSSFYNTGRGSVLEALRLFPLRTENLYPLTEEEWAEREAAALAAQVGQAPPEETETLPETDSPPEGLPEEGVSGEEAENEASALPEEDWPEDETAEKASVIPEEDMAEEDDTLEEDWPEEDSPDGDSADEASEGERTLSPEEEALLEDDEGWPEDVDSNVFWEEEEELEEEEDAPEDGQPEGGAIDSAEEEPEEDWPEGGTAEEEPEDGFAEETPDDFPQELSPQEEPPAERPEAADTLTEEEAMLLLESEEPVWLGPGEF